MINDFAALALALLAGAARAQLLPTAGHAAPCKADGSESTCSGAPGATPAVPGPRALQLAGDTRVHMHQNVATLHVAMPGEIGLEVRLRLQGQNLALEVRGPRALELFAVAPQLAHALLAHGLKLQVLQVGDHGAAATQPATRTTEGREDSARTLRSATRNARHVRA